MQGQLAIPRPAGRKCEPKDRKSLTVGMVYNGHRVLLWALLLLESSAQVIQGNSVSRNHHPPPPVFTPFPFTLHEKHL